MNRTTKHRGSDDMDLNLLANLYHLVPRSITCLLLNENYSNDLNVHQRWSRVCSLATSSTRTASSGASTWCMIGPPMETIRGIERYLYIQPRESTCQVKPPTAEIQMNFGSRSATAIGSLKPLICSDIFNVDTQRSHANNLLVLKDQALLGVLWTLVVTIPLILPRRRPQISSRRL